MAKAKDGSTKLSFFPHDVGASQDIKCKRLINKYDYAGYGRWWKLCEMIANADDCKLPCDEEDELTIIAEELHMTEEELLEFLAFLSHIGLINNIKKDRFISSTRMQKNMAYSNHLSSVRSKAAQARWNKSADNQ